MVVVPVIPALGQQHRRGTRGLGVQGQPGFTEQGKKRQRKREPRRCGEEPLLFDPDAANVGVTCENSVCPKCETDNNEDWITRG
jgi:hypothetical protein